MTRIGKVKTAASSVRANQVNPDMRCFQLIVEGGKTTLGCWVPVDEQDGEILFKRIS